MNNIILF